MVFSFKHFRLEEFACPCCGRNEINWDFVKRLDSAREFAGVSFEVTSGFRCKEHNEVVGGSPTSEHLEGLAADVACRDNRARFKILSGLWKAGFQRIGIGPGFVHVGMSSAHDQEVVWLYK